MRHRINTSVGVILALSLVVLTGASPQKTRPPGRGIMRPVAAGALFETSGRFTGALGGEIQMNGASLPVAETAMIYEIGVGRLPVGSFVNDRVVYLSGTQVNGRIVIRQVIVRPPLDVRGFGDGSQFVREQTTPGPR